MATSLTSSVRATPRDPCPHADLGRGNAHPERGGAAVWRRALYGGVPSIHCTCAVPHETVTRCTRQTRRG
eukprot:7384215-Prymnesium_polylepis.1